MLFFSRVIILDDYASKEFEVDIEEEIKELLIVERKVKGCRKSSFSEELKADYILNAGSSRPSYLWALDWLIYFTFDYK